MIKQESVTGLWGSESVASRKDAGRIYWSREIAQISEALALIESNGRAFWLEKILLEAIRYCPSLAILALNPRSKFDIVFGYPTEALENLTESKRNSLARDIKESIDVGGFALLDQFARNWDDWLDLPGGNPGGH